MNFWKFNVNFVTFMQLGTFVQISGNLMRFGSGNLIAQVQNRATIGVALVVCYSWHAGYRLANIISVKIHAVLFILSQEM